MSVLIATAGAYLHMFNALFYSLSPLLNSSIVSTALMSATLIMRGKQQSVLTF